MGRGPLASAPSQGEALRVAVASNSGVEHRGERRQPCALSALHRARSDPRALRPTAPFPDPEPFLARRTWIVPPENAAQARSRTPARAHPRRCRGVRGSVLESSSSYSVALASRQKRRPPLPRCSRYGPAGPSSGALMGTPLGTPSAKMRQKIRPAKRVKPARS